MNSKKLPSEQVEVISLHKLILISSVSSFILMFCTSTSVPFTFTVLTSFSWQKDYRNLKFRKRGFLRIQIYIIKNDAKLKKEFNLLQWPFLLLIWVSLLGILWLFSSWQLLLVVGLPSVLLQFWVVLECWNLKFIWLYWLLSKQPQVPGPI